MAEQKTVHVGKNTATKVVLKDKDGKEVAVLSCVFNMPELKALLEVEIKRPELQEAGSKIEISMIAQDDKGLPESVKLVDDEPRNALAFIESQIIPAPVAVSMIRSLLGDLTVQTDLKVCLVTSVFGEVGLAGFGMVTTLGKVETEHITTAVKGGENQLQLFKDELRQRGYSFPDDNKIVLPGDVGWRPPNLTVIEGGKH